MELPTSETAHANLFRGTRNGLQIIGYGFILAEVIRAVFNYDVRFDGGDALILGAAVTALTLASLFAPRKIDVHLNRR